MYQSIFYDRNTKRAHIWDDKNGYKQVLYSNYAYIKSNKGKLKTLDGHSVQKILQWSEDDIKKGLIFESDIPMETKILVDNYLNSDEISVNHTIGTIDIEVESTKGFPDPQKAKNPITSICFHENVNNTCFTYILDKDKLIKDYKEENHIVKNDEEKEVLSVNLVIRSFQTEEDLLNAFIVLYNHVKPTILTGWNIEQFDIPYLYHRLIKLFNVDFANQLSSIKNIHFSKLRNRYFFAGIAILDYYNLYKRFTYTEESSYTLDYIGTKNVKLGKLKHGTSLDNLYKTNIKLFLEYNIRDVVIVLLVDKKFKFITLTQGICHKCHVPYEDVYMPSRYLEGAILTYMKRNGIVCPVKKEHKIFFKITRNHHPLDTYIDVDEIPLEIPKVGALKLKKTSVAGKKVIIEYSDIDFNQNRFILKKPLGYKVFTSDKEVELFFTGAFVKNPQQGLHEYICDLDAKAMYPNIIMSANISVETKIAKIIDWNIDDFINKKERAYHVLFSGKEKNNQQINSTDLYKYINDMKIAITPNGVLYTTAQRGLIPIIIEGWGKERDEYRELENKFGDIKNKEYDKEKYEYFSRLQSILKVLSNSLYGVLGLNSFRFFDMDNASAVTAVGYQMINYCQDVANDYYNKELKTTNEDYVIYGDTDSLFLKLIPFLKQEYGEEYKNKNVDELFEFLLKKIKIIQSVVNKSLDIFAKSYLNIDSHSFSVKQELIAERGFWFDVKKRYALKVIWEKGFKLEKPRYDYKGIEVVRSDFPTTFRLFYKFFINSLLDGSVKDYFDGVLLKFYKKMREMDILDMCKPTSCSDIVSYTKATSDYGFSSNTILFGERAKGAPAHIKAALNYNDLLKFYKLGRKYETLKNGSKVRWTYLKKNEHNIETIAIKGYEDPPEIIEFVKKYIDYDKNFENILKNKILDIYRILEWGDIPSSNYTKLSKFFRVD